MPEDPRRDPGRQQLGREGERRAANYLEAQGYRIEDRNVRVGGVEIDLIARRGRTAIFVEVKTRRGGRHGGPFAAIDARKRARMQRAAIAWLSNRRRHIANVRFDVVAVHVETSAHDRSQRWRIEHWPAAFDAND